MPTPAQIKTAINADIRTKTLPSSITTDQVSDILDDIVDLSGAVIQTLTDGATITFDAEDGLWGKVTIAGNRTFSWVNFANGMSGIVKITQDGVGGRSINWGTAIPPDGGVVLDTAPGGISIIGYIVIDGQIRLFNEGDSAAAGLPVVQPLTDGATITFDADSGLWATVTIAGNRTFSWSNFVQGMSGVIKVTQDGVGGRTINWGTATLPEGGVILYSDPGDVTYVGYTVIGSEIRLFNEGGGTPGLPEIFKGLDTAVPNADFTMSAGQVLIGLLVRAISAQTGFKVGTTAGGDDVISEQDLDATTGIWHSFPLLIRSSSSLTIYITAPTGSGVQYQPIILV